MPSTTKTRSQHGSQKLPSINPRTGESLGEVTATDPAHVADIVEQARKVAPEWASIPPEGRARILREVRYGILDKAEDIIATITAETGKPRAEALAHEVFPPLLMFAYTERMAPKILKAKRAAPLLGPLLGYSSRMEFRPFGVVGCISPWNFPITNTFLSFTSALFAGNVVVVKPSEVTPKCGEMVRQILDPLPSGVATVIQGRGDVGAALVDAPCDKIAFIGSPPTGRKICEAAAKHLTPVVMELGGKDAAIVCSDADLDVASSGILWSAFAHCGQICASIERTYVVDSVADRFEEQLLGKLQKLEQGDQIGSLTFGPQLDIVANQVDEAIEKGARVLAGGPGVGKKNENGSLWYAPTVVTDVTDDMAILRNESFGPILNLIRVRDEDEALRRANEDGVNLTASVWTKDRKKRDRLVAGLKSGSVTTNFHGVEVAPAAWGAWGGIGESGYGRINGPQGLMEFSVPVHVSRSPMVMKRPLWYPYDESSEGLISAMVEFLGSRDAAKKLGALPKLVKSYMKAAKTRL